MCKTVMGILNHHTMAPIQFHDTLNGFRTNRGTGTNSTQVNLLKKLENMRDEVLYEKLFDIHKAYEALDCDLGLEIIMA